MAKAEPKKETVKKQVIKKEPKKKRVTKAALAAALKDAPKPNEPVRAPVNESPSPTKQLSTKILSLSLNEENNEEAGPSNAAAAPAPEKNSRKRPKSESPKAPKGSGGRKKPKRKLTEEVEDKKPKEELHSLGNTTLPNPIGEPIDSEITSKIEPTDTVVESETASNSMSVQAKAGEGVQPKLSEDQNQNTEKSLTDTTDAKKIEEAAVNVQSQERGEEQVHTSAEFISAQNNEIVNGLETATKTMNSIESSKTIQNDNSVLPIKLGSSGSIIDTQKIETQILATAPFSFFNCQEAVTFADLAKGTATIPKVGKSTIEFIPENSPIAEESTVEPEVEERQEEGVNSVKLPNLTNDEDMPVLKPEASSSAAVSRSESFAERMESIDEDVSNSSNHSIVPQHAPVLSKEAAPARANRVVKVPMDCNTVSVSSESTVIDQDEQLGELPMIEGEEEGIGMRRDRSDSLSMRSCGSGSPSEKIKTLDDIASKDKEKPGLSDDDDDEDDQDQECLPDSDSNDSLMSEFSELAAQLSEKTDGVKFKEECIRFLTTKVSANSVRFVINN